MNIECVNCAALHWKGGKPTGYTVASPKWESCCKKGSVSLPLLNEPPMFLRELVNGAHPKSSHFLNNIRQYNAAFVFTSFGTTGNTQQNNGTRGYMPVQVHGELYHLQGPINAHEMCPPMYNQLYIYDPEFAARVRREDTRNGGLDEQLIQRLSIMLHVESNNPVVTIYKHAHEVLKSATESQIGDDHAANMHIRLNPQMKMQLIVGNDRRTENLPTVNEIAAIIPNEYSDASYRDILITFRNNGENNGLFKRINETHAADMPLHYVLLFPAGDYEWHWGLRLNGSTNDAIESDDSDKKRLTQRAFYRYRLHQYLVDAWAVCEQTKLDWIKANQSSLRADVYNGLADATNNSDSNLDQIGQKLILPSSFTSGPRFMAKLYHDMAISRYYGKPSLFITFTANPNWKEIKDELFPVKTASDRPDIVARVFNLTLRELLDDLKKKKVFGKCLGIVRTIEYQKRGLPHCHILLFLENKFDTPSDIDVIISAKIPDKNDEPDLYLVVSKNMMHGPCGVISTKSPCMVEDAFGKISCSKKFPKPYQPTTLASDDGYPLYRRSMDGRSHVIRHPSHRTEEFHITNCWVVPYNPFLSKQYKAHINVEVCGTVKAIKYINKYIYKGPDQTIICLQNKNDEIEKYLNGRYISPVEAAWRIFEFPMHEETPSVTQLAVHLPGEQPVYFDPLWTQDKINETLESTGSTLMGYLKWNLDNRHKEDFNPLLYQQFPETFVWDKSTKVLKPRKNSRFAIGRMYYCNPSAGERYYLRLLLTVIKGATSFVNLRTVNNVQCETFREACMLLHLIEDDEEWKKCFEEAGTFASGTSLRSMFVSALLFNSLNSPPDIWEKFGESFCDDLDHAIEKKGFGVLLDLNTDAVFYNNSRSLDYGLYLLEKSLQNHDKSLRFFQLPLPMFKWNVLIDHISDIRGNTLVQSELSYSSREQQQSFQEKYNQLNTCQREVFDTITLAINNRDKNAHFFLQGPAGTGKTYIYNTLCNYYRSQGKIVLCVASSGIAALLLPGGRTSHSRFSIPIQITQSSGCHIKKDGDLADLIRNTALIIWDEVPMQHRHCFEAVDRTFRDICNYDDTLLFGGVPVVLSGDFAQIPPVVTHGNRPQIVDASLIMSSALWPRLKKLFLTENMRLANSVQEDKDFAEWIGKMSYDSNLHGPISLPAYIRKFSDSAAFIEDIYPNSVLQRPLENSNFFKEKAILCSKNINVEAINSKVLEQVVGDKITLFSSDTVQSDLTGSSINSMPEEYLHSLATSGLPPAKLELKIGLPVMLLRNLNPERGLCNGTRLIILQIGQYVLKVKILGGSGLIELIPRFTLSTLSNQLPFILTRKQFPVKVSSAMTINKSQCQSLNKVALDLETPVFNHGQLYVALSRATSANGISVLFSDKQNTTENVVYPELLIHT